MQAIRETWLRSIGSKLRLQGKDVTEAQLPQRWVDLIHYLDEQERKLQQRQQPEYGFGDRRA